MLIPCAEHYYIIWGSLVANYTVFLLWCHRWSIEKPTSWLYLSITIVSLLPVALVGCIIRSSGCTAAGSHADQSYSRVWESESVTVSGTIRISKAYKYKIAHCPLWGIHIHPFTAALHRGIHADTGSYWGILTSALNTCNRGSQVVCSLQSNQSIFFKNIKTGRNLPTMILFISIVDM